jgi:hypothetical protein
VHLHQYYSTSIDEGAQKYPKIYLLRRRRVNGKIKYFLLELKIKEIKNEFRI